MPIRVPLLPRWLRWSAVLFVALAIFYLSIVTVPPPDPVVPKPGPDDLLPLDKWRHFLAYATLAGALAYATADWSWPRWHLVVAVVGATALYGIGIEAGQAFLPDRYFSLGDAWANVFGALLVLPWYAVRPHLAMTPLGDWLGRNRSSP